MYAVTIPDWSDGCSLTIENIDADSPEAALARVVAWVNARAGYHYCDRLPCGTKVYGPDGLITTLDLDCSIG